MVRGSKRAVKLAILFYAPQYAPRVCGERNKVSNDRGYRVSRVPPYGLPKKTPERVFFCAQTLDFTGISKVFILEKYVARNRLFIFCKILTNC